MYLYSDSQIGRTSPKLEKKFMVSNLEISGDLLDSGPGVVMSANAAQTDKEPNVPRKTSCLRLCQICDEIWRPRRDTDPQPHEAAIEESGELEQACPQVCPIMYILYSCFSLMAWPQHHRHDYFTAGVWLRHTRGR